MATRITKRTKADVAATLDELYLAAMATKPKEHDKWLVARAAEAALSVASGLTIDPFDDARLDENKALTTGLRNVLRNYRAAIEDGRDPWEVA